MIPALYNRKPNKDSLGIDIQVIREGNFHVHSSAWAGSPLAPEGPSSAHRAFKESLPRNLRVGKWIINHRSVSRAKGDHNVREVIDLFAHYPDESKSKAAVIGRITFECRADSTWQISHETLVEQHANTVQMVATECGSQTHDHADTYDGEIVSNMVKSGALNCGGVIVKRGRWFIPNEGNNIKDFLEFADVIESTFPVRILTLNIPESMEGLRATMLAMTKKIEEEADAVDDYVSKYVEEMSSGSRERRQYTKEKERLKEIRDSLSYISDVRNKMTSMHQRIVNKLDDLDKAQAEALFGWVDAELGKLTDKNLDASNSLVRFQNSLDVGEVVEPVSEPPEVDLGSWDEEPDEPESVTAIDPVDAEFDALFEDF